MKERERESVCVSTRDVGREGKKRRGRGRKEEEREGGRETRSRDTA